MALVAGHASVSWIGPSPFVGLTHPLDSFTIAWRPWWTVISDAHAVFKSCVIAKVAVGLGVVVMELGHVNLMGTSGGKGLIIG